MKNAAGRNDRIRYWFWIEVRRFKGACPMIARLLASVSIATVLASPAFAADAATKPNGSESQSTATQPTQNLPAQIRAKLEQDGFTNVSIVPGSFLVSAKDKNGDPVTMVIGPI